MEVKKVLEVKDLKKHYGKFEAVKGISFDVKEGEFFAFLGPNGAGKSTSINTMCTIIDKTDGQVKIAGYDLDEDKLEVRKNIGLVFQENISDKLLSVEENLKIHCHLYHVPKDEVNDRITKALKIVQLEEKRKVKCGALSGGMKRRVEVAKGILHLPKILFLDEPTAGLDPQTRINMWDFLMKVKDEANMAIFLTTHHMDEAEQCDRVAIIDNGVIIALGTPGELKEQYGDSKILLKSKDLAGIKKVIGKKGTVIKEGNFIVINTKESITELVRKLSKSTCDFSDLEIKRPTLNDVFINLTGREMRESD